jgi:hypothetical protein
LTAVSGREKEFSMHRRHLLMGAAALLCAPALARAEVKPYDPKTFAVAQERGENIVLAVNASW